MTITAVPMRLRRSALTALAAAALGLPAAAAWAQSDTVVIGSPGGSAVQVDLSVLEPGGGRGPGVRRRSGLLFPGSVDRPGQRIILRPPGSSASAPRLRRPAAPSSRRRATLPAAPRSPALRPPPRLAKPAPPAPKPAAKPPPPKALTRSAPPPPPAVKPAPKSRATAKMEAPPIVPKAAVPAPKSPSRAPSRRAAVPPVPPPPEPPEAAAVERKATKAAPPPPPPPAPPVSAAPRAPVKSTPLESTPKPAAPATQSAAIPRPGPIVSGTQRQVLFAPGSARLESDGRAVLDPIVAALKRNPSLRVELKAYARGNATTVSQSRRLSLSRALAIRSHLIKGGVGSTRIDVRALGSQVPSGVPNRVDILVFTR